MNLQRLNVRKERGSSVLQCKNKVGALVGMLGWSQCKNNENLAGTKPDLREFAGQISYFLL